MSKMKNVVVEKVKLEVKVVKNDVKIVCEMLNLVKIEVIEKVDVVKFVMKNVVVKVEKVVKININKVDVVML